MLEPFQCEEVKIQNIDKFFPAYRTRRFYNGSHFSVLGEKDLILLCNPIQGSSLDVQKELGKRTFFLEIIGGQISPLRKIELIVTNLYPEDESQNKPDKISNKCSKKTSKLVTSFNNDISPTSPIGTQTNFKGQIYYIPKF